MFALQNLSIKSTNWSSDNYDADIEVWKNTPESDPDKQAAKDLGKLVCELQELGIGGDIIIID